MMSEKKTYGWRESNLRSGTVNSVNNATSHYLKHEGHSLELHVCSVISCKSDVTEHKVMSSFRRRVLSFVSPFFFSGGGGVGEGTVTRKLPFSTQAHSDWFN